MTALLLVPAAIAAAGAIMTVRLALRDGYGPVRSVEHHDTRCPGLHD